MGYFIMFIIKKVRLGGSLILIVFALGIAMSVAPVEATSITFTASGTGTEGALLSASAEFEILGGSLFIVLTNTALDDNNGSGWDVPSNTLTGLFWDWVDNPVLTEVSAIIAAGSIVQGDQCDLGVCNDPDNPITNVGGEFGFKGDGKFDNDEPGPGGARYGIGSSGYIGGHGTFNGPDLDKPDALNGINFGIISLDTNWNPNGGLSSEPLIQNSVTFLFSGATDLSLDDISNVSFQYGTGFDGPNIVPEPSTIFLLGSGLLGLSLFGRRRKSIKS